MTETNIYLATALRAMHAGVSVLPPRQNGSKRPLAAWKHHQSERADEETIRDWYANGRTGVGVVPGRVSGGLELFEFDEPGIAQAFIETAVQAGMAGLIDRIIAGYCELTPGGGVHWFWRCSEVDGNTKLARRPDPTDDNPLGVKVLIETRGEGGFAIVAPSSGNVHPSGAPYRMISGDWETVARITPEERRAIFDLARTFDQMPVRAPTEHFDSTDRVATGGRPGDLFAARTDWRAILEPAGWRFVFERDGVAYWRRPGKTWGISASTNYGGSDLFYVFSTSTIFEPEHSYTKFGVYTALNHGGDYGAAGRALIAQQPGGVLVRHERVDTLLESRTETIDEETGEVTERTRRFEIIDGPDFLDRPPLRWMVPQIIPEQSFVCLLGQPGSYKTFLALDLGLSKATGTPFLGKPTTPGAVLYIAAEGAGGFGKRMRAWMRKRAAIPRSFKILPGVVPLTDAKAVADLILDVQSFNTPFELVIVDTLSRSMPGANENASEDMTAAVDAATALQRELGCVVVILHHGVKQDGDSPKSPRGHSSLPGALDTIIVCEKRPDGETVKVSCAKQKDGQDFGALFLRRVVVDIGDGRPVDPASGDDEHPTSIVLEVLSAEEQAIRRGEERGVGLTSGQRLALRALWEAGGATGTTRARWWDAAKTLGVQQSQRYPWEKQKDALIRRGLVTIRAGATTEHYVPDPSTPRLLLDEFRDEGNENEDGE